MLNICIPTFNRPECLNHLLNQLTKQTFSNFKILISDDSSSKMLENKLIIQKFSKILDIKYYYQSINLGFSENIKFLYGEADNDLIWFLCDDDLIYNNSVENIYLNSCNKEIIIFRANYHDAYGNLQYSTRNSNLEINKIDRNLFLANFLSVIVIRKKNISINDIKCDNVFIQLSIILKYFQIYNKIFICKDVIVYRKTGYKYGDYIRWIFIDDIRAIYNYIDSSTLFELINYKKKIFFVLSNDCMWFKN